MTDPDNRTLQAYLARPLDELMEELDLYDPASRGPAEAWRKITGPVRQRICLEWDYCTVRQDASWDDGLQLAVVALGVLASRALQLPISADLALVAAIVTKRGLDAFCGCF